MAASPTLSELAWQGVYRRDIANGIVLVNPGESAVTVTLETPGRVVVPAGGGALPDDGVPTGSLSYESSSTLNLPPRGGAVVLTP